EVRAANRTTRRPDQVSRRPSPRSIWKLLAIAHLYTKLRTGGPAPVGPRPARNRRSARPLLISFEVDESDGPRDITDEPHPATALDRSRLRRTQMGPGGKWGAIGLDAMETQGLGG